MKHLTEEQRYTISVMKQCNKSIKDIAIEVNKDKSTIYRELYRNCDKRSGKYIPKLAQKKCDKRHKEKFKKVRFTNEVKQYVDEWINEV